VFHAGQALPSSSQRQDQNIRGHNAAIDCGESPFCVDAFHFAKDELKPVLLGQILQIHQVLLDAMLARDHPYRGGIDE